MLSVKSREKKVVEMWHTDTQIKQESTSFHFLSFAVIFDHFKHFKIMIVTILYYTNTGGTRKHFAYGKWALAFGTEIHFDTFELQIAAHTLMMI